ncbi:cupin domain-containing protein [Cupriavidus sp. 2TAF22]|uniref:cupin domain-containing protein n=1 Tax=unclassified Cupriavidus TaxID=2640874 RepID=UPI003F8E9CCC
MAQHHAATGEIVKLRPLGAALRQAQNLTLVRAADLQVMRLVLPAGKSLPEHSVPGAITVLCLEGAIEMEAHGSSQRMDAGDLMYLAPGAPHALRGIEDASVLMTLLHHRDE